MEQNFDREFGSSWKFVAVGALLSVLWIGSELRRVSAEEQSNRLEPIATVDEPVEEMSPSSNRRGLPPLRIDAGLESDPTSSDFVGPPTPEPPAQAGASAAPAGSSPEGAPPPQPVTAPSGDGGTVVVQGDSESATDDDAPFDPLSSVLAQGAQSESLGPSIVPPYVGPYAPIGAAASGGSLMGGVLRTTQLSEVASSEDNSGTVSNSASGAASKVVTPSLAENDSSEQTSREESKDTSVKPEYRECSKEFERVTVGNNRISRYRSNESGVCVISILGFKDSQGNTRNLAFKGDGVFSIVVSMNRPGRLSQNNYMRAFQIFPRHVANVDFRVTDSRELEVLHSSEEIFSLDHSGRLMSYSGGDLKQATASRIDPRDEGGISITLSRGVLLDYGFRRGGHPGEVPTGKAKFIDSRGNICQVTNKEILNRVLLRNGGLSHTELKFKTDSDLKEFLESKCPTLDVSALD